MSSSASARARDRSIRPYSRYAHGMPSRPGIVNLMQGGSPYPCSPFLRAGLHALSLPYLAAISARNFLFDKGLKKTYKLPWPVVSIGNLTTGGTGKTPFVLHTANH